VITEITPENHSTIKNPVFSSHAAIYLGIYEDFMKQVRATGIEIDENNYGQEIKEKSRTLRQRGAKSRNGDKSTYINAISPACVACQTGVESETFFISLKCHRECYFCFNSNQVDYEHHSQNKRDLIKELDELHAAGVKLTHIAVTGGEPLLYPEELIDFYIHAAKRYPGVYKRLYTCGDHLNEEVLQALCDAGLEEIRLSIRMYDLEQGRRHTLERVALAKRYVPNTMIEMPVLPGTLEIMQSLLLELNELQIASINLLEFCYPFFNPELFKEKGFKIKNRPYKIPYNYWYAGGLPISQSEVVCFDLLEFTLKQNLDIGVHYCSLENKFTAQIYGQNFGKRVPNYMHFSSKDYFFKSAKVFGDDVARVQKLFEQKRARRYRYDEQHQCLEFHVKQIKKLRGMDIEVGIATSVVEKRGAEEYLRELKVDMTHPDSFDLVKDVG
jgi:uncharacterized protein